MAEYEVWYEVIALLQESCTFCGRRDTLVKSILYRIIFPAREPLVRLNYLKISYANFQVKVVMMMTLMKTMKTREVATMTRQLTMKRRMKKRMMEGHQGSSAANRPTIVFRKMTQRVLLLGESLPASARALLLCRLRSLSSQSSLPVRSVLLLHAFSTESYVLYDTGCTANFTAGKRGNAEIFHIIHHKDLFRTLALWCVHSYVHSLHSNVI